MTRMWTLAALTALSVLPAALAAQEPAPRARPRVRTRVETGPFGVFSWSGNRGRIGVVVKAEADSQNDKIGASIEAVTPGGPAEKAGLKAGDIITRFSGTALGGVAAEDDEQSGPGMKLIELARALDPGDTVQVDYRRGSESRKGTLVAEEVEFTGTANMDIPGMIERAMPRGEMGGEFHSMLMGAPWGGIELVSLNADLGEYFGTREGVLVVKASGDSTLPLKGGDVILSIGGRKPTSPEHAMRILRSYDTGETVTIDVQRKQKRTTLSWKVPDESKFFWRPGVMKRGHEEPSAFRIRPKVRMASPLRAKIRALRVI